MININEAFFKQKNQTLEEEMSSVNKELDINLMAYIIQKSKLETEIEELDLEYADEKNNKEYLQKRKDREILLEKLNKAIEKIKGSKD